jgi:hypothetical protein
MIEGQDRFDRLMKLAEFRLRRWDSRNAFGWKITLGLWAVLAATCHYIPIKPNMYYVAAMLIVVVISHAIFWVAQIFVRSDEDMDTAFWYTQQAELVLGLRITERPKPEQNTSVSRAFVGRLRSRGVWAPAFQIVATILLAIGTYWALSTKPWPN